jgi:hypothetical protein
MYGSVHQKGEMCADGKRFYDALEECPFCKNNEIELALLSRAVAPYMPTTDEVILIDCPKCHNYLGRGESVYAKALANFCCIAP